MFLNKWVVRSLLLFLLLLHSSCREGVDYPTRPDRGQSGFILISDKAEKGYLGVDCDIYSHEGLQFTARGRYCNYLPGGRLVMGIGKTSIAMLNEHRGIIWRKPIFIHHDISVNKKREEIGFLSARENGPYGCSHTVEILNYQGDEVYSWDISSVRDDIAKILGRNIEEVYGDLAATYKDNQVNNYTCFLKLNSLEIIGENNNYPENKAFKPGNLLLNVQLEKLFIIIDRETRKIVWSYRPAAKSHSVKLLKNGNIFYLMNRGVENETGLWKRFMFWLNFGDRISYGELHGSGASVLIETVEDGQKHFASHSHLIEYSVKEDKIVWDYSYRYKFHSPKLGYARVMKNNNILVSHITHGGAVFEINRNKKIVEEWINPDWRKDRSVPNNVYYIDKLDKELVKPFIENAF
ncbi:MAG: hypothetical protein HRT44_00660 [Bdellovibrionales bacterium]|nr:hypothetical protein [Bdellovibrionales bacterium]NQZ17762.1 hypothetical protein [Bdellovibrionales bacterium]